MSTPFASRATRFGGYVLGLLFGCAAGVLAAGFLPQEREVKAVLLFHLTHFVTWPASSVDTNAPSFKIGILGPDPFGAVLDHVVKGEKVGNRPVELVRADRVKDLADCRIVYVSPEWPQSLPQVFEDLRGKSVLTVGESEDFLAAGGIIRFKRTESRKVRLEVHLGRARVHGFAVSAQLLRVADVLGGDR